MKKEAIEIRSRTTTLTEKMDSLDSLNSNITRVTRSPSTTTHPLITTGLRSIFQVTSLLIKRDPQAHLIRNALTVTALQTGEMMRVPIRMTQRAVRILHLVVTLAMLAISSIRLDPKLAITG